MLKTLFISMYFFVSACSYTSSLTVSNSSSLPNPVNNVSILKPVFMHGDTVITSNGVKIRATLGEDSSSQTLSNGVKIKGMLHE